MSHGFTKHQRRWILGRDNWVCALCGSATMLHVHHIVPQRWARVVLGWSAEQINTPYNGVTLCARCHVGPSRHCIHPDMMRARRLYPYDRESYKLVFGYRDMLCSEKIPYWNTKFDSFLAKTAAQRSLIYGQPW